MTKRSPRPSRIIQAVAAAAVATTMLAACSSSPGTTSQAGAAAATTGPYKIGVLLGLTGSYAAVAEPQQKALKLYEKQLNAAGGVNGHKVQFVYLDTGSDESQAVNQMRKLATEDQVIGVVGPSSSGEGAALKPIAASLKLPMIAIASGNTIVNPVEPYAFKEFPASVDALQAQLAYAKKQGMSKVAILSSNNAYGQEPAAAAKDLAAKYGLQLVANETFAADATDMTPQLTTIGRAQPDATLVWGVMPAPAIIARNAKDIGFKPVLFMGTGAASAAYLKTPGPVEGTLVEGAKVLAPDAVADSDPQAKVIKDFAKAWRAEYASEPSQFAGGAWDAMLLMVQALKTGTISAADLPGQRDQVRAALEDLQNVPGTIAVYSFSKDVHGPKGITGLATLKISGGKFTLVSQ